MPGPREGHVGFGFILFPGVVCVCVCGGVCWEMSAPLRALHIPDSKSNAERQARNPPALLLGDHTLNCQFCPTDDVRISYQLTA